ncbi:NAD(P)-dependent oxidoreductase [Mycobacterium deserti]|uniref:NAD(P)-dependent oxidoreductase n=1 Tax=Mycobacterium deserti TaxID=2978347 RepID=A0ABT2M7U5_9MYCO|nr:NAD(P)-dependent oxidoreductase [Mycobacterium deserti]MCT7657076.1 NAD(P)-dependent oxidoreductase [Mycobacterium deserti]
MSRQKVVGFIGAGNLGEPMVSRLLAAGNDVLVYARRPDRRDRVAAQGATVAESASDLARRSDVLVSCLFSDAQLIEVGLGPDGLIANAKAGSVFVSHTTGTVSTLTALRDSHPSPPVILDAPVSGTVENIDAGNLTVLLGGPSDAVREVTPVLAAYADPIVPTGELGSALAIKLVNNVLFSCNAQLLAAAIELGQALGVDADALLSALQVCSGASHATAQAHHVGGIENFTERATPFLRKDIAAALEAAGEAGVDLGLLGVVVDSGPLAL